VSRQRETRNEKAVRSTAAGRVAAAVALVLAETTLAAQAQAQQATK